ncbi:unnamed protein product [Rotaria magnacalcarata]
MLLVIKWRVLAKEYTPKEGSRKSDVKMSLNDNITVAALNSDKFYVLYSVSNNSIKTYYKINYHEDDVYVYGLSVLKTKSDQIVSFLQVVKNIKSNSVLLSRIDINLFEFRNSVNYQYRTSIDKLLNNIGQGHILIKVDTQEKYAYVFADSFILSYNLLTNELYQSNETNVVNCDGDNGSFIPHAADLSNKWAAMVGFHRILNSSRSKSCLYIFKLPSLSLIQARSLDKSYIINSENIGYNHESIMSASIDPSGMMIAIGQAQSDTVTIAFINDSNTPTNISEIYQIVEDVKLIDFGRSVAWLDDKGTLAVLVGKSGNRTGLQSEIQVFTNISSNPTSVSILPKYIFPNNQQTLHGIPYKFGWRRRSYLFILAQSRNLLIFRDDGKIIHIPSADPGFCSMEHVEVSEVYPKFLTCFDGVCPQLYIVSIHNSSSTKESTSMVYSFLSKPCVSGTYKSITGFGPCTVCPSGTKNPGGNKSSDCQPCKPVEFCSLGASSEVNLTVFDSTTQVFSYPDSPIIDNYDDVLLLNFIPNTWTAGCVLSSPLFVAVLFIILSFIIWLIMLTIKKRQLTSFDTHRKRAKRILKHTDLIGEGERFVGGLASIVVFAIIIYSIVFAVYYFFSYSSDNAWIREACNDSLRNTKFDNALQLPLPDPKGNDWKIFQLLNGQKFTMAVDLINTGVKCDHIDVHHKKHTGHSEKISKTYCNDLNNNFTTSFSFQIPTHVSTAQVAINGPYFIGAIRLCLHGLPTYVNDEDEYRELKELDVCTLFHTDKQTIGLSTYFNTDLVRVVNVTKPLRRSQHTNYSAVWKPITTYIDNLSDELYYAKYGEYLRYASDQTTFTVKFKEQNYYVQNNKSPIIRRGAITFHTFMFMFLLIDTIAMLFLAYKLWGQPLVRCLLQLCYKSREHEFQSNHTETTIEISSKFITNCPTSQDIQQQYCAKNAVKAPEESAIVEYSELPHSLSTVQPPFSLTTPSATQAVLASDYLTVECPREYFDKRDLKDLDKLPISGLGVTCPDESDPFVLHCNVLINDGPYHGVMIHLILHIPEDYPLTGPAGNIAPGLEFNSRYHGHIHEDYRHDHILIVNSVTFIYHFQKWACFVPGYTLSTALLQIVTFFADPDLRFTPSAESIADLRRMVKNFTCKTCGHSYANPNPSIVDYNEKKSDKQQTTEEELMKSKRELMEKLTCGVTKQNVIEDQICLGYPLLVTRDNRGRLWPEIVLELISYDAYVAEIQKSGGEKLDFYENLKFRSVTGADYNHWLPLYINANHFRQGQTIIQNSISVIYNGTARGSARYDFMPNMALSVLTTLMNKSAVRLFNGQMYESAQAIEAYCHFLRLLMHFIDIFPALDSRINKIVEGFTTTLAGRNKKVVPDIGEFLIQIALSTKYRFNDVKKYVYEEYFARQIYWIQKNSTIKNLSRITTVDLPEIFQAVKVSNHLLVFNLEMAETFIFPGVKERLDRLYGYPPTVIVEKFQTRLKAIKAIDRYSVLMQAIRLSDTIKSPDDMIDLIKRSIHVSNQQGYTNI